MKRKHHRLYLPLLGMLLLLAAAFHGAALAQDDAACGRDVFVRTGDTLSGLATEFGVSSGGYAAIVRATNARAAVDPSYATIADPNMLNVGWKLCIPGAESGGASVPDPTAAEAVPLVAAPLAAAESVAVDATPTPVPTPTATPVPPEQHPLAIPQMRQQSYPGSEIVIEQVLDPGANYSRYIASYRSEGHKIFALLTVPLGEKPAEGWPVVIFNHGYIPPEVYRTTERYVAYVDAFARNGYIVFRSDYRGHGFSEGEASGGYGSPAYTVDVLNAVAAVKNYADADPNRIGMWGHSMGGHITLRSMVVTDDVKAGVIWAGVVGSYPDLLENWRRRATPTPAATPDARRRWRDDLVQAYGSPAENPAFWALISPNSYLADLSGPVQLHHGSADSSVPIAFSETLNTQIQAAGGTVEYYAYPGDDHNIAANFGLAMARSVEFMDRYLKGTPAP